jgi:hypothetical protein
MKALVKSKGEPGLWLEEVQGHPQLDLTLSAIDRRLKGKSGCVIFEHC